MILSPLSIFSALAVLTAWLGSIIFVIIALRSRKRFGRFRNEIFLVLMHWAIALFLVVWVKIPTFLASFGKVFIVSDLTDFYAIAFIMRVASYILFFRGMMFLVSSKSFWLNTVPLWAFTAIAALNLFLFFGVELPVSHIGNIMRVFHYAVIGFIVWSCVALIRRKDPAVISTSGVSKAGIFIFMFGWIVFFVSDLQIATGYNKLPTEFWFINLVSSPVQSIGFSIAHILILAGIVVTAYFFKQNGGHATAAHS